MQHTILQQRSETLYQQFDRYNREYEAAVQRYDDEAAERFRTLKIKTMAKLLGVVVDEHGARGE